MDVPRTLRIAKQISQVRFYSPSTVLKPLCPLNLHKATIFAKVRRTRLMAVKGPIIL